MNEKTINFATTFQQPIHALLDGQPVTLLATGDVEGMSPSFQYCDQSGKVDWAKASRVTVIDPRALPAGTDLGRIYSSSGSAANYGGSSGSSSSRTPVGAGSGSS